MFRLLPLGFSLLCDVERMFFECFGLRVVVALGALGGLLEDCCLLAVEIVERLCDWNL